MATAVEEDDCNDTSSDGKTSPNDDRLCTTCNSDENKKKSKWASLLYNFMLIYFKITSKVDI